MELVQTVINELYAFWKSFLLNMFEWIFTICIGFIAILISIKVEPLHNSAVINNPTESYPYTGETISNSLLFVIVIFLPCVFIGLLALFYPKKIDLCLSYLSLAQCLFITLLLTEILKVYVARPRPNYFHYCGYDKQKQMCTGSTKHQKDAKVSFPSGHASISFCSAVWLSLFIQSFFNFTGEMWWILLRFIPILIAIFISATRITDYMHHASDVVAGALLGIGVSTFVFTAQSSRIRSQIKKSYDPLLQL